MGFVGDVSGPEASADPEEVPHHSSSGSMDFVPGIVDPGTLSWDVAYESTNELHGSTELLNDLEQGNNRDIRVVAPTSIAGEHVADFPALITNVGNEFPAGGGEIRRSFETQATNTVTWSTTT